MTQPLSLREQIHEDWLHHNRRTFLPGLHALVVHRVSTWAAGQQQPVRLAATLACRVLNNVVIRNLYGLDVHPTATFGRRVKIAYHMGVVIGPGSVVGDDVLIRHNVTLGRARDDGGGLPRIGNRVQIGAGAIILGDVTVGDGALIGPGAMVVTDVPAGGRALAPLARITGPRGPSAQVG